MSDVSKKDADNAAKAYIEAVENHNQLLDKYFPVRRVIPGTQIVIGETITLEVLKKFEEAETMVTETRRKWTESLRRMPGFQQ